MKTICEVLKLFVLFYLADGLLGCQCFQAAHRNDAQCAVINQIVDCTETAVVQNVSQFKPVVQQLIALATGAGGQIDWTRVETALETMGVKDGGCILASIEHDYLNPTGPQLDQNVVAMHLAYRDHFEEFRAKHYGKDVKFKLKLADGSVVFQ